MGSCWLRKCLSPRPCCLKPLSSLRPASARAHFLPLPNEVSPSWVWVCIAGADQEDVPGKVGPPSGDQRPGEGSALWPKKLGLAPGSSPQEGLGSSTRWAPLGPGTLPRPQGCPEAGAAMPSVRQQWFPWVEEVKAANMKVSLCPVLRHHFQMLPTVQRISSP